MTSYTSALLTRLAPGNGAILSLDEEFATNREGILWTRFMLSSMVRTSEKMFNRVRIPFARVDYTQIGARKVETIKISGTILNGNRKVIMRMHGQQISFISPDYAMDARMEITRYPIGRPYKFEATLYPTRIYRIVDGEITIEEGIETVTRHNDVYLDTHFVHIAEEYASVDHGLLESMTVVIECEEYVIDYDLIYIDNDETISIQITLDEHVDDFSNENVSDDINVTQNIILEVECLMYGNSVQTLVENTRMIGNFSTILDTNLVLTVAESESVAFDISFAYDFYSVTHSSMNNNDSLEMRLTFGIIII